MLIKRAWLVCWTNSPKFILTPSFVFEIIDILKKVLGVRKSLKCYFLISIIKLLYAICIIPPVVGVRLDVIKIPKIDVESFTTMDAKASGAQFPAPSWAWNWPWGWYKKIQIMYFLRVCVLTKIPKIHVKSFKTVDSRASGLHFPTPSCARSWPWG